MTLPTTPDSQPTGSQPTAVEVLKELEWSGWQNVGDGRTLPCCPTCRRFDRRYVNSGWLKYQPGQHAPDCRLAAALATDTTADRIKELEAEVERLKFDRNEWRGRAADRDAECERRFRAEHDAKIALTAANERIAALESEVGRAALRSADMSTAPKDGTRVLIKTVTFGWNSDICQNVATGDVWVEARFGLGLGMSEPPRWLEWCGNDKTYSTDSLTPLAWARKPEENQTHTTAEANLIAANARIAELERFVSSVAMWMYRENVTDADRIGSAGSNSTQR